MEDFWRVPFTVLMCLVLLGATLTNGFLFGAFMYLWSGLLIYGITGFRAPKLVLSWLPALWIPSVLEWSVR